VDNIKKFWLDVILKDEATISSEKRRLETRFWSLVGVFAILNLETFWIYVNKLHRLNEGPDLFPLMVCFIVFFWMFFTLMPTERRVLWKIHSNFKDFILRLFYLTVLAIHILIILHICNVYFENIKNTIFLLFLYGININLKSFFLGSISICSKSFELLKDFSLDNLGIFVVGTEATKLYYILKINIVAYLCLFSLREIFIVKWKINNMPDLKDLKLKIISGELKTDETIRNAYMKAWSDRQECLKIRSQK
jgi:hypothetical protein